MMKLVSFQKNMPFLRKKTKSQIACEEDGRNENFNI